MGYHGTSRKMNKRALVSVAIEEGFASGEGIWFLRNPMGIKQRMDHAAQFFHLIASQYDEFGVDVKTTTPA